MAETLPTPQSTSPLDVGASVGDTYELVRVIGRGGMGEVWAARHRRLPGKLVAIKVLHTGGKDLSAEQIARFRREAEIASRIGHPNIVQVIDFNTLPSGEPYLVLELLQGESLASKLRFGALAIDEAVSIARQTGSALKAAHAQGIVHRDLKPDNIFLVATPMGTMVKVLDFGISKVRDSNTVQTQEAVLMGTPQYMSPEQAIGANKDVGPQSDVFALGAITYEMLCGQPPFQAESVAKVVFEIAYQPHTPLATRRADLPPRVVQAVEKALLKDRTHRWSDIGEFVAELSGKPLEDSGIRPLPEPSIGSGGVATPSMQTPGALDATAMKLSPPPDGAALVDTKSKDSSSSSSGSKSVAYTSTSSTAGSRKWVAYVVAAGLVIGFGGTAFYAQQTTMHSDTLSGSSPELAQAPAARSAAKTFGDVPREFPEAAPAAPPPAPSLPQLAQAREAEERAGKAAGTAAKPGHAPTLSNDDTDPNDPLSGLGASGRADDSKADLGVPAKTAPPPRSELPADATGKASNVKAKQRGFPLASEYAGGSELEELAHDASAEPKALLDRERPLMLMELSPRAKEYLRALLIRAHCRQKDQQDAQAMFRALSDQRLRGAVSDFCAEYIGRDMLK
ncbi:MAG: serine/threonine-protein kinase [Myxococcaceae bacterium]